MNQKKCKICNQEKQADAFYKYKRTCKECLKAKYQLNKDACIEYQKAYNKRNSEKLKDYKKEYRTTNCKEISQKRRIQINSNPKLKIQVKVRAAIAKAFKRYSKNGKTQSCKAYGIDFKEIFCRIGIQPVGDFHLDHIIPVSAFDFDIPIHVKMAHSPENLQWLSSYENQSKSNSITDYCFCSLKRIVIGKKIGLL